MGELPTSQSSLFYYLWFDCMIVTELISGQFIKLNLVNFCSYRYTLLVLFNVQLKYHSKKKNIMIS